MLKALLKKHSLSHEPFYNNFLGFSNFLYFSFKNRNGQKNVPKYKQNPSKPTKSLKTTDSQPLKVLFTLIYSLHNTDATSEEGSILYTCI